ncbi:hypothetical protein Agub_g13149, partial [Astrephomene gubernaculifera]
MLAEQLFQCLQALPNREAEAALLQFRAQPESWETCVSILSNSHCGFPESLQSFAAQTLHASARRVALATSATSDTQDYQQYVQHLIDKQQGLLTSLIQLAGHGHLRAPRDTLLCAALAALSVRNPDKLQELLSAALGRLPHGFALQLLLDVAEEGESLLARLGGDVESSAALHQVLREELGPHVTAWLAARAHDTLLSAQGQQPHGEAHGQGPQAAGGCGGSSATAAPDLRLRLVRCFAGWVRLGCLYAASCPADAVQQLVGLLLHLALPRPVAVAATGQLHGAVHAAAPITALQHEACEALGAVIEYGPDSLLRALLEPVLQLAAAAAEAGGGGGRAVADADAVYDIVQLVSSYSLARLDELVRACGCGADGGGGCTAVSTPPPLTALAEALVRLAALTTLTPTGYPVGGPAVTALADLALGCIAAADAESAAAAAGEEGGGSGEASREGASGVAAAAAGGSGGCGWGEAMQQDEEGPAGQLDATTIIDASSAATAAASAAPATDAFVPEHCVPYVTLGPRPGLPPPLVQLYDNVLHAVLSCCVVWGSSTTTSCGAGDDDGSSDEDAECHNAGCSGVVAADDQGSGTGLLMRLPPESSEAVRSCLQACAGVVGQARQLATAAALLQGAAVSTSPHTPSASISSPAEGPPPWLLQG